MIYEIEKIINKRIKLNGKKNIKKNVMKILNWKPEEQLFNAKEAIEGYEKEMIYLIKILLKIFVNLYLYL